MLASAKSTVHVAWSRGLRPDPIVTVAEWAEQHRRIPEETSPIPGRWRNATTPYLVEPMRLASPSHPARRVTLIKSAQIGGSELITNFLGTVIDTAPGPTLVVHPTVEAGKDWTAEKFDAAIQATRRLRDRVADGNSRDSRGSTMKRKRFPGGFIIVTGANSTRALRQRSIRYVVKDDWSDWPQDVDGQGDPDKMADARQIAYEDTGTAKSVQVSTPTVKGACRVTKAWEASDQRRYLVPCPHCGWRQHLRFRPDTEGRGGLRFDPTPPFQARYACEDCGSLIDHHEKRQMLAKGAWLATSPGPGRQPGFALNALYSPFVSWDKVAEEFVAARDDPHLLKTFVNLWLGEAWEEKGDAPEWEGLKKRAEDYPIGILPVGAALVTIGIDVQKRGLYFEVVAWGPGKTSWSIDFGYIEGDTDEDPSTGAVWAALDEVYQRTWPTAGGNRIGCDMLAIDAGYATQQVYSWARARPRVMAVKGTDGWDRAVLGQATPQMVNYRGKKIAKGVLLWPVYTWNLKSEFYAQLRKPGPAPGAEEWPAGYCHYSTLHPDGFFQQQTAESLIEREVKGRLKQEWKVSGDNHYLDARIYAMAAFHRAARRLGVLYNDLAVWAALIEMRGSVRPPQAELPLDGAAPAGAPPRVSAPVPARPSPRRIIQSSYVGG
ncbi:phage terminase large subunit GpA-like protein [Stella humosa]|uniref:Phage terminase large subunit GpA-like protein n=1 Tax=Stella humosa TaxID=94 RepID=A0A3N1MB28_9PROT|nr:terminase gpA endonuclease subunit [Stella humosa]ROQ00459.1 phage terminase large subunit GpA-like protein [Stella humosa]BBK30296.1 terminase [Stella humosa]